MKRKVLYIVSIVALAICIGVVASVSYTHLDVYKRQVGERAKYDVMVAAHTAHTETAYQTIAEYRATAKCSTACFARARIYGGYYPDPQ